MKIQVNLSDAGMWAKTELLEHQPACVLKPTTRRRDNRIHRHTPREGEHSDSTSENQGTTLQTDDSMDRKQRTADNPGEATSFHPHANRESQKRSKGKTISNISPKSRLPLTTNRSSASPKPQREGNRTSEQKHLCSGAHSGGKP
ncbi:hypothetical protein IGI04_031942 [Brassica rapa subsp. trilocularis]|uniref:DUF4005 domain-containing protein n=1 Tax=Brassica rapa subsp. trilocularis TaxID=1813537 RepID=A0ABQ7LXH1_BRACM|nr:hypothetical protein IGI04_031942 [Brassica rapa subsp. trilocularis]